MEMNSYTEGYGDEPIYDLRAYRVRNIADHIEDIKDAAKQKNYADWYYGLRRLFAVSQHLISKSDPKVDDEYDKLHEKVLSTINEHVQVYFKKSYDQIGVNAVQVALMELEMFLYNKLEASGAYGKNKRIRGL